MLSMQDISNWQGPKAPEHVAKHEVLAIKATEGTAFLDPDFPNNWKFAEDNEKARVAYCFLHPSLSGRQQAEIFLDYIRKYGLESGDMFAADIEISDGLDPAMVAACGKEFCDTVATATKANPFVYSNIFFIQAGNLNGLQDRPLWIADPSHPPAKPEVPAPFDKWLVHQYGVVRGIDADVVNVDTVNQLAQYGALVGEPDPPPNTTVMHLTDGTADVRHDFNDKTPIETLKGTKFTAGDAVLEFK